MANYTEKPKKRQTASRDIALDKMDMRSSSAPRRKTSDKIKGRPKNGFQRFCIAAFPQAEDTGVEKMRKTVLLAAIVVFVATIAILLLNLMDFSNARDTNSKLADLAGVPQGTIDMDMNYVPFGTTSSGGEQQPEPEEEEINVTPVVNTPISVDFPALKSINPDTRAWVKITGTYVNNVVCQSTDNDYYLKRDFYGNDSISGTVFASYKNKFDGTDDNIVLYGHNMIDGTFFASLGHYVPNDTSREPVAFYKVHPTIMLSTPNEGCQVYKIFAGCLLNTQDKYGEVFEYVDKTNFSSKDDFNNFIIGVMDRSWFFTDVDLDYGDQLLTLSTCYWPIGKNVDTRWVIFARKVRPGESEFVDTTVAERNYQARLFDYYYSVIGGQWYGSTWDKSKLKSYTG